MVDYTIFSELLQKNNIKTADVCRATGIDHTVFAHWKKGDCSPKADKLQKIADYFHVSLFYLMGVDENPNPKINEIMKLATGLNEKQQDALINFIKTML